MAKTGPGELRTYGQFDFSGGLDVKSSPQFIASRSKLRNRLTRANHVVLRRSGGVTKRLDTATYNTSTLGASVQITGGFQFRHSNGTDYNLCGTSDGRIVRLNSNGTTTNLATGLTTSTRWYFTQYEDLAIICNRADAPRTYDGTTLGTLAGSPPSTGGPVAAHGNRVLFLDATQRSRLTWSALNDPEDYTSANNAGSVQVMDRDGSDCLWLLPEFYGECLIGKTRHVYRLQGTSPSTYAITNVVPLQVSIGGISHQGVVFGNNDGWWISQRGVHSVRTAQEFGDLRESFPSERIDDYFVPNTNFTVSLNQLTLAVAAYDPQHNRLYFGVDTDNDAQNDTLLVLDVFTGGWSVWGSMSCASLWTAYNGTNGYEVWMGGYDGFVRRLNVSASTNAISGEFRHVSDLGDPGWEKAPRHLFVYASEEGNINLTVVVAYDFGATGGASTSVSLLGGSRTLGVNWTLGTDALGARAQIKRRIDLGGSVGEYMETRFSNNNAGEDFTVFGYEVMYRRRRRIARAS